MKYYYFVSYVYTNNTGTRIATDELMRTRKINSIDDLIGAQKKLKAYLNAEAVIITNYKLLRKSRFMKD